jgi:hypothetical protein
VHAQAVAGLHDALLIAVADAGVDVEAAEAEAMMPAAMKTVSGGGGGYKCCRAERSCRDQSRVVLRVIVLSPVLISSHCYVPVVGLVVFAARSIGDRGVWFQDGFVDPGNEG